MCFLTFKLTSCKMKYSIVALATLLIIEVSSKPSQSSYRVHPNELCIKYLITEIIPFSSSDSWNFLNFSTFSTRYMFWTVWIYMRTVPTFQTLSTTYSNILEFISRFSKKTSIPTTLDLVWWERSRMRPIKFIFSSIISWFQKYLHRSFMYLITYILDIFQNQGFLTSNMDNK